MLFIISTLLPVFGLIFLGWLLRTSQRLGEQAASELNRFVVWLCLPSLLFHAMATAAMEDIWNPGFVTAFTLSTLLIYGLTLLWRVKQHGLAVASLDALSASYANTGYVGIPLCLFVLGDAGLAPALVSSLVVVSVLFAIAVIGVEISTQKGKSVWQAALKVTLALLKNPLVVAPFLGVGWNLAGWPLPHIAADFLQLIGDATVPAALVSLGAFLAHKQPGAGQGAWPLVFIKLIIHPLLTWVLAYHVFALDPLWAAAAVLLAALPTGTGPYMLAEFYRQEASVVSRTILFSTLASVLTLAAILLWLPQAS
ncbi:MAG: transporter [Oceanospirillaceae bacterium]|nr:transporter [Oceanospirillaceae bacterium]MBT13925.1 transporter [Oceanospirillaceae bacterium]|tara:strand:- start:13225 stop:14157 length:933 start_codon:yes stop_codon:yes gene_type:complete